MCLSGRWDSRELSYRKWEENVLELHVVRACPLLQPCLLTNYFKFSSKAPNFLWEFLASELKNTRKHQIMIDCSTLSLVTSTAAFWRERPKPVCLKQFLVEFGHFFLKIRYFTSKNHHLNFFPLSTKWTTELIKQLECLVFFFFHSYLLLSNLLVLLLLIFSLIFCCRSWLISIG